MGRCTEGFTAAVTHGKGYFRMGQRQSLHGVDGMAVLRPLGLEKLESCRRGIEQVPYLDPGPRRVRRRLGISDLPALHAQGPGRLGLAGAARERQTADSPDRWESLAAKTQGQYVQQIVRCQLGGRVSFDGELEFIRRHADAVVDNHDPGPPPACHRHIDTVGACVDCILDQFLDGRAWPLDHLAGSDPADECFR